MDFYDRLAPYFHLVHAGDWEASVERQGRALDDLLVATLGRRGSLLDAACGVGTQALGLAARGWRVTGSDVSSGAIERARREAADRGLAIDFSLADLRAVADHHQGRAFDAVIACDNALPHLLTDDDLAVAFAQIHRALAPGGVCVISVRDYAALIAEGALDRPTLRPQSFHLDGDRRYPVFQTWEPQRHPDGRLTYALAMYVVEDEGGPEAKAHVFRSEYHAVSTDRLLDLMAAAGFTACHRRDDVFFQPLLIGRR